MNAQLPTVLRMGDGSTARSPDDWARRRAELLATVQREMFGHLPPAAPVEALLLASHVVRRCGDAVHDVYRLTARTEPAASFTLDLYRPPGDGPFPVFVNGDGCWRYVTDAVLAMLIERGFGLAQFDRTQIMPDLDANRRDCDLVRAQPAGDFGALAAWAWGHHRVVDYLLTHSRFDAERIGVVGHSRGGKTALLAGATDERVSLVNANGSGCGGAGCLRYMNSGSETLERICRQFPFWFARRFADYGGREQDLPFDAHDLKALVAPRPLLTTEAYGDRWANPAGTLLTHVAARPAFELFDAGDRIAFHAREGEHRHDPDDWRALVDFADRCWFGRTVETDFDESAPAARLRAEPLVDAVGRAFDWPDW